MRDLKIFKNSKVIVTGHTGFKGSWLTAWLKQLNADVMGISLNVPTSPSHFKVSKGCKQITYLSIVSIFSKLESGIVCVE